MDEQVQIFQIRSHTNPLPSNRGQIVLCPTGCGKTLNKTTYFTVCCFESRKTSIYWESFNGDIYEMKKDISYVESKHTENRRNNLAGFNLIFVNPNLYLYDLMQ